MAFGRSQISVDITGDASSLKGALGQADAGLSGTVKKLAIGVAALGVAKQGFEFVGDSLNEFDRLGDATARLEFQLGELAAPVLDAAAGFADIGLSTQDVAELAANFADLATAAGITDDAISDNAATVAALGQAVSLLGDMDAEEVVDLIGKAAGGATRALRDLGVSMTTAEVEARALADTGKDNADQLTAGELAAARLAIILDQLSPKLDEASASSGDLEQKQAALEARVETLQAQLGEALAPALEGVLQFILDEIDAIPHAIEGWQALGGIIEDFARTVLGPLGNVADVARGILDLFGDIGDELSSIGGGGSGAFINETDLNRNRTNSDERNGLSKNLGRP